MGQNIRLTESAETNVLRQEQPVMETLFPQRRIILAIVASAVGIAVSWLMKIPFGLLAPMAALFLFARGRTTVLLHAASMIAMVGFLLAAAFYGGATQVLAVTWAAFFALALCIGVIAAIGASAPLVDEAVHAIRTIECMPVYTWSASPDGRSTFVSSSTLSYVGLPANEPRLFHNLDNAGWRRIVHPDDYDKIIERRRHALKAGVPYDAEYRLRRRDGMYRWVKSFGVAPRDDKGQIVGWYGTMIDIEEQKQAEVALRDRERELSQLVDMVPSHLWRLAPNGEPIFLSKRMVDFIGIDIAQMSKPGLSRLESLIETIHPDDAPAFRDALGHCLATGQEFFLRYRLRRADGIYRWMSSRAEPLRDKQGCVIQWYGLCHDIEDQVRAEVALRGSEHKLRQMIDAVPTMIWSADCNGAPTYVNRRFSDITGATLEDITAPDGSLLLSVIHPDDAEGAWRAIRNAFATGETYVQRYRQLRANGRYRWTETRAEPLRDEDGAILQWYGVSVDIDDVVTAQTALREREQELSQLVNMVPVHISRLTTTGEPTFFNKRLIDFLGLDVTEVGEPGASRLSATMRTLIHPDDSARLLETVRHSVATGEGYSMKYRMRRADGVYRWVNGRSEPLRDDEGEVVQWYAISIDIDDEMRLYKDIEEREAKIRRLVDSDIIGIVIWDLDGLLIDANDAFLRMIQYEREDLQAGLRWFDMTPPEWQQVHAQDEAKELAETGKMQAREKEYFRKDGSRVPVLIGAACFEGQSRQGVAYILDLTERKRAEAAQLQVEEALRSSQAQLQQLIKDERHAQAALQQASDKLAKATQAASLAELSASIAHEVNQPLAAIAANSHACQRWLKGDPPNLERAQLTVGRIIRDVNSAAEVVSRIRALFKQSADTRTNTALSGVIAEACNLVAEEAARRRVRMDVEVDKDLPLIAFDRVQIQQVLINLIRNGMDAMDAIAEERVLEVRVRLTGNVVQTAISDRGPGIEFPDKIFEPFFTTKERGMGMGLAICRSIVESHGGRLWVEHGELFGAKFCFTLPAELKTVS
jgi:PAS domain S-box-containing protein